MSREKLFAWEKLEKGLKISMSDFRGTLGLDVSSDCRNYDYNDGLVMDWSAICSLENWGEKHRTPQSLPDGDTGIYDNISKHATWCDLEGKPCFNPNDFMQISGRGEFD